MGRETGIDHLVVFGFRIVDRQMTAAFAERRQLGRGVGRALLAEGGVLSLPVARREPHAAILVQHGVMDAGLAVPDDLIAPIGRRHDGLGERVPRPCVFCALHRRRRYRPGHVFNRVQDGNRIGAEFRRAIKQAVGIDRRVAPVGRNQIMQILLWRVPVAHRDHDIALDTLRPVWLGMG